MEEFELVEGVEKSTVQSVDFSPILDKMDLQNNLIVIADIFLFGLIVFNALKLALRGLWK